VADLVVELGAVVVGVAAVVAVDALDEVPVPDVDDVVELTEVSAAVVVPGISLDTTRPSTAAAPAARTATALDVRRTLVWARSRRCDSIRPVRRGRCSDRCSDRLGQPSGDGIPGEALTTGMSPCQPRITRTVG
jgi:hypothetical protein